MGSMGENPTTSHHLYPPFPEDIPTAPLVSINLSRLEAGDEAESKAFFEASKNLGFFYLQLSDSGLGGKIVEEAEQLNALQKQFFELPDEVKEEYAREKIDSFMGYRAAKLTGEEGGRNETLNVRELYNVRSLITRMILATTQYPCLCAHAHISIPQMRKDDFVGNAPPLPCHSMIKSHWDLLSNYVQHCRSAIDLMLSHLETHLRLPRSALANLHRLSSRSGDHVRFNQHAIQPFTEEAAKNGEHTDFGTLTILMNWLGGLQIRVPDSKEWVYVKPVPGSAVVNLGDALVKFTAGILKSNIHRVVPPPAPQDGLVRNSLVYFSRPEDKVLLRRLEGGLVDEQLREKEEEGTEMTAEDWTFRRSVGDLKGVYTHKGGLELRKLQMA